MKSCTEQDISMLKNYIEAYWLYEENQTLHCGVEVYKLQFRKNILVCRMQFHKKVQTFGTLFS